jgi:hypothetical protein
MRHFDSAIVNREIIERDQIQIDCARCIFDRGAYPAVSRFDLQKNVDDAPRR